VLERRCVLSVAPLPLESEALSLEAYVAAGHDMGPVAPTAMQDASAGEPLSPIAVDMVIEGSVTEGNGGDAEPTYANDDVPEGEGIDVIGIQIGLDLPPQIVEFSVEIDGTELWIHGRIMDDHDLTLCQVTISGLVEQSGLSVDESGSFQMRTEIPMLSEFIYAVANDGHSDSDLSSAYFSA